MSSRRPIRILAATAVVALAPVAQASLDLEGVSRDLDACQDFYQYANRKWLETTAIPDDRSAWGSFAIVDRRNEELVRSILEAALQSPPPAGTATRKVVDYYASGLDLAAIERAGLAPLAPLERRIAEVADAASLARALAALHEAGVFAGFSFYVRPDARDSSRYLAEIAQGGLGLPDRDFYFLEDARSKQWREAYRAHLARVFALAGEPAEAAARSADAVFALETELARASMTQVEQRDLDRTYNKGAVGNLAEEAPGLPWRQYLDAIGARQVLEVNVAQPDFFKALGALATQQPPAQWRAYLRWHLLKDAATKLPRAFVQADFDFYKATLEGKKAMPSRHRQVLAVINGNFGDEPMAQALGRLYVERAFPADAKARALALVTNLKGALGARLRTLEWMGEDTRREALAKLAAMRVKIGYPDRWRDYADAEVGPHGFAGNWMRANAFELRRQVALAGRPVDRDDWWMAPQIVNAYYSSRRNEIVFPAGILQPPFFDPKADDAVNYGAIGMVIGHEITHGFDDRGRRFDARGNLRDWWTPEDERRYLERARLVEKQFDAYEGVEGVKLNGKLTLGENLSDIGGLKIAYLALQKALEGKPRAAIDGLSPEQRFFLSFAQAWRSRYRPEHERLLLQTDAHSPPRFRVRGTLANMPEFDAAFSCRTQSRRAAGDHATIW